MAPRLLCAVRMRTLALVLALAIPSFAAAQGLQYGPFKGYKGYVAKDHVVPKTAKHVPTIIRWRDKAGAQHQTHLSSEHLSLLLGEIRTAGGSLVSMDKTSPGMRFVPSIRGEY